MIRMVAKLVHNAKSEGHWPSKPVNRLPGWTVRRHWVSQVEDEQGDGEGEDAVAESFRPVGVPSPMPLAFHQILTPFASSFAVEGRRLRTRLRKAPVEHSLGGRCVRPERAYCLVEIGFDRFVLK